MNPNLEAAIASGKAMPPMALYFGCWDRPGHYLVYPGGRRVPTEGRRQMLLPWPDGLMDGGLLQNGKHADVVDGRVWWTAGGNPFWYAFFWWDRSGDKRGASNSGLYVRGFGWPEPEAAFEYGCQQFPHIVKRQAFPLALQEKKL